MEVNLYITLIVKKPELNLQRSNNLAQIWCDGTYVKSTYMGLHVYSLKQS